MPDGFTGPDWWQTLYDDTVAALLLVRRDPAETTATVRFLTGPRLLAAGLLFPFTAMEVAGGNVSLLLAVAIVVGFRWPAAWALVLLTKITPGIGLLWFAVRREWRSLAWA